MAMNFITTTTFTTVTKASMGRTPITTTVKKIRLTTTTTVASRNCRPYKGFH